MAPTTDIALWRGLDWLLGGPLPPEIFERVLREPGVLHTLATGAAVRELWGGEPFWSEYRGRFRWAVAMRYPDWDTRMTDPKYPANLLFVPGPAAARARAGAARRTPGGATDLRLRPAPPPRRDAPRRGSSHHRAGRDSDLRRPRAARPHGHQALHRRGRRCPLHPPHAPRP